MYDGQDEPEFEYGEHDDDFEHPTFCRVNIYKKEISRPIVGTATWKEFFPSQEKKQFMWKKMPKNQLSKCAEAQGLRKAFPQKLNKLYAEEEMQQAIENARPKSTKPQITQPTVPVEFRAITEKQVKRLYALCKAHNVKIEKLKEWLKISQGIEHFEDITIANKQYDAICESIEKIPDKINNYSPYDPKGGQSVQEATQQETPPESAMPHDVFKKEINTLAEKAGIKDVDRFINEQLKIEKLDDVVVSQQSTVIDLFNFFLEGQNGTKK